MSRLVVDVQLVGSSPLQDLESIHGHVSSEYLATVAYLWIECTHVGIHE